VDRSDSEVRMEVQPAQIGTKERPREVWSVPQFRDWLQRARRGEWCCYWLGHLSAARDNPPESLDNRAAWAYMKLADGLGQAAYYAHRAGLACLVQRRTRLWGYQYLAIKR